MSAVNLKDISFEDLTKTNLKDLLAFESLLTKAIVERKEFERAEVMNKIHALASDSGFELEDLLAGGKTKKPAVIKYRNPENPIETWTGRGRKPKWVEAHLKAGASLEELEI